MTKGIAPESTFFRAGSTRPFLKGSIASKKPVSENLHHRKSTGCEKTRHDGE